MMTTDVKQNIPAQILAQINNPPLLKGESASDYYDMFGGVASDIEPGDMVEWLWTVQFVDCVWEILRFRRYRAMLIDLGRDQGLRGVIQKVSNYRELRHVPDYEVEQWKKDPTKFGQHEIDPNCVPAVALLLSTGDLETIDKILGRAERRSDTILQQLEYRREMFAHRARRVAENLLNAEHTQPRRLSSASIVAQIEPAPQMLSSQATPDVFANEATSSSKPDVSSRRGRASRQRRSTAS